MKKTSNGIQIFWKSKRSISTYLFLIYFIFVMVIYLRHYSVSGFFNSFNVTVIVLWLALSFLSIVKIDSVRSFFAKYCYPIDVFVLLLSIGLSFFMSEVIVGNINQDMFQKYGVYNVVWYALVYLLIFALSRKFKLTVKLGSILIYIASMVNYFVLTFRGNPILPSDLLAWKTGVSVASGYELQFTKDFVLAALILYLLYFTAGKLEEPKAKISIVNRLIGCGFYLILILFVFNEFFNTNLIKSKIRVIDFFAPKYTYSAYGTAFGFVANINALITKRPDGYSVNKVKEAFNNLGEVKEASDKKPNIIVIMNEAFSDLSLIGDYQTNMDYLPYIRSLSGNTVKGKLFVSVFGGATSDTEYEFLTGNSMAVMPANCVPYQQFVTKKTDSFVSTLKEQGYYEIAIHPYEKSGYKRDIVYPLFGFDQFLGMDDFKDPELIRSFISDKESYKKIIEEYETRKSKSPEQPLFIFNVTMQDHGGYSGTRLFGDDENVKLIGRSGYADAEQYLSLLRKSDEAFQTLVDYFSKQKEPTIILLFGDHQPIAFSKFHDELEKNSSDLWTLAKKYEVPFIMWANYDTGAAPADKISANYLSSYLLKAAGLKGTEYNDYLLKLYKKLPVINALFYMDNDNHIYRLGSSSEYSDLVTQYQYVGYNNVFDTRNRLKQIFRLNN